jgi:hypothetical protein
MDFALATMGGKIQVFRWDRRRVTMPLRASKVYGMKINGHLDIGKVGRTNW